ncbi:hypothetical protein MCC10050_1414 [Bifidobacterium longum subsp. longum]|nr:hypothetical protein MCC10050_1414 [Bifidobacterium longum subsp. longum]
MLIPSKIADAFDVSPSLSRRVNANSQHGHGVKPRGLKLIKKGEC